MTNALYAAMNGAKNTLFAQSVKSNNLANAKTPGFKADIYNAMNINLVGESFPASAYVLTDKPAHNFNPGSIKSTGRELDVAIDGDGWFAVQTETGDTAYTRAGNFQINSAGLLTTGSGRLVLGNGGPIAIPPAEQLNIGNDGTITIIPIGGDKNAPASLDRLQLVTIDHKSLSKGQDGLMHVSNDAVVQANASLQVKSGFLEGSNVNAVSEMVDMIALSRQFEMQMKIMQQVDEHSSLSAQLLQLQG